MKLFDSLNGAKVSIRVFNKHNLTNEYISWLNDPEVVKFSNQRFKAHTLQTSIQYLESFTESNNLFLSIYIQSIQKFIGTMTVYFNWHHGTADVGIMIGDKSYWKGGFGSDAFSTVVNWLIEEQKIRKVTAGTLSCNQGMIKIMSSAGMQPDGVRKRQEIVDGIPVDIQYYARFGS